MFGLFVHGIVFFSYFSIEWGSGRHTIRWQSRGRQVYCVMF